ncbi:uncharacterized protein LOC119606618 [Lucilia sericata]|uniref:uncharacterized protein LOC119606618 n=1 Tax=Lucilia sericata TaxID=13632 RepID=UPI0018A8267A|nr:uncharacterized protein LOC119606618 [Lucilia sericata]
MLSLVADYDTSSSSSSSEEDETENEDAESTKTSKKDSLTTSAETSPPPPLLLPSANVLLGSSSSKTPGDVFNNPFLEAEKLEIDKLQKHVKMVDSENHLLQKNGRKICWNNRKGRCRFGNKCKYAHDSDLVETNAGVDVHNKQSLKTPATTKTFLAKAASTYSHEEHTAQPEVITSDNKNRKRPGLGDSIVPGKRVMKTYQQTKNQHNTFQITPSGCKLTEQLRSLGDQVDFINLIIRKEGSSL